MALLRWAVPVLNTGRTSGCEPQWSSKCRVHPSSGYPSWRPALCPAHLNVKSGAGQGRRGRSSTESVSRASPRALKPQRQGTSTSSTGSSSTSTSSTIGSSSSSTTSTTTSTTTSSVSASASSVFVTALPLDPPPLVPLAAMALARSLLPGLLSHRAVVIRTPPGECFLFDFRPRDPQDPRVMLAALRLQAVPGIVRKRPLPRLPPGRLTWLVGSARHLNALEAAEEFSQSWDPHLRIFHHDCSHYAIGLVTHLVGEWESVPGLRN